MLQNKTDRNEIMYKEKQSMKIAATTAGPAQSTRDTTNTNMHL
jgi:hypothetical protein